MPEQQLGGTVNIADLNPLEAAYLTAKERSAGVADRDVLRRRRHATQEARRNGSDAPVRLRYTDDTQPDLTTTALVANDE